MYIPQFISEWIILFISFVIFTLIFWAVGTSLLVAIIIPLVTALSYKTYYTNSSDYSVDLNVQGTVFNLVCKK